MKVLLVMDTYALAITKHTQASEQSDKFCSHNNYTRLCHQITYPQKFDFFWVFQKSKSKISAPILLITISSKLHAAFYL